MQKVLVFVLCVALSVREGACLMNAAQIKSAGKLLRNVCQPKTKITVAQIDDLHKGIFNEDKEIKNYIECVLRTGQLMKDGAINFEYIQHTLNNMPEELATPSKASLEVCKGITAADKVELAFAFYKCFYEDNPKNFFLP